MAAFVQHVRILHGGAEIFVTEQFLNGPNVISGLEKMRGERMPECVTPGMLGYASPVDSILDSPLQNRLVNVMPSFFACLHVFPPSFLRKDPLPAPVLWRVRILTIQGVGQEDTAPSAGSTSTGFPGKRFSIVPNAPSLRGTVQCRSLACQRRPATVLIFAT